MQQFICWGHSSTKKWQVTFLDYLTTLLITTIVLTITEFANIEKSWKLKVLWFWDKFGQNTDMYQFSGN